MKTGAEGFIVLLITFVGGYLGLCIPYAPAMLCSLHQLDIALL